MTEPRVKIEVKHMDEQFAKLSNVNAITRKHAKEALNAGNIMVLKLGRTFAPRGSGRLASSLDHEITVSRSEGLMGRVLSNHYTGLWVEYGTAPHMPPSEAISANIPVGPDEAFLIARSIAARGTRGRFFLWRAYKESERSIKRFFSRAVDRITRDLAV